MKKCINCGADIKDDAKFCRFCGTLQTETQLYVYCEKCGVKNEPGSMYCEGCGAPLGDSEEVQNNTPQTFVDLTGLDAKASETDQILAQKKAAEEAKVFEAFEVEKSVGGVVIKGLKDRYIRTVEIPESVSVIAEGAFTGTNIISVTLPEGLIEIGEEAFKDCKRLKSVNIPKSVQYIEDRAFSGCELLEIEIPKGVTTGNDVIEGTAPDIRRKAEEARKAEAARKAEEERRAKEAMRTVGATITFGKYPTTENVAIRDIDWRVLKVEGKKALLISSYGIDAKPYNVEQVDITWENCSLRKWLNGDFLSTAFSSEEKRKILDTRVKAEKNPSYSTNPGNDTTDRIFLLSIQEAKSLLKSGNDRKCVPTDYAKKNGAYTNGGYAVGGKPTCWWWLRSPGYTRDNAARVKYDGSADSCGNYVNRAYVCVRPALWINLED